MNYFDKIIILGTGNAQAINCYNTCFALRKGNEHLLCDGGGGNGILKALEKKSIPLGSIHNVIVTHAHTDHIMGIVWIYRMISAAMEKGAYDGELNIYCHDVGKHALITMLELMLPKKFLKHIDNGINIIEVKDGDTKSILGERFTFFDILSTKAKQFGFYFETGCGRVICLGDEPCSPLLSDLVQGAALVMHEAFCLYEDRERFKPYEKHHSTVKDAAEFADAVKVKKLLLYHTEDKTLSTRKNKYTEEASRFFDGVVYVPDDYDEIDL